MSDLYHLQRGVFYQRNIYVPSTKRAAYRGSTTRIYQLIAGVTMSAQEKLETSQSFVCFNHIALGREAAMAY